MTDLDRLDAPSEEWQRGFEAAVATRGPAMTTWRGICGHLWDRSIEDTDDCPRCATVRERDELREAAEAVVKQADADDDPDGQYVDFLVPADAIEALRAALHREAEA